MDFETLKKLVSTVFANKSAEFSANTPGGIPDMIQALSDADYLALRQQAEAIVSREDYATRVYNPDHFPYNQLRWAAESIMLADRFDMFPANPNAQVVLDRSGLDAPTLISVYFVYQYTHFVSAPNSLSARYYNLSAYLQQEILSGRSINVGFPVSDQYRDYVRTSLAA